MRVQEIQETMRVERSQQIMNSSSRDNGCRIRRGGRFEQAAKNVIAEEKANGPDNTDIAYHPKIAMFKDFCNVMYKEDNLSPGEYSTLVTEEKMFGFLYYQSRRPQKKRG